MLFRSDKESEPGRKPGNPDSINGQDSSVGIALKILVLSRTINIGKSRYFNSGISLTGNKKNSRDRV